MKFGTIIAILKSEAHQPLHPRLGQCSSGEALLDAAGEST